MRLAHRGLAALRARPYGPDGIKSIEIPLLPGELEEEEDLVIAQILASIRSAPVPADGGL